MPQNRILFLGKLKFFAYLKVSILLALFNGFSIYYFNHINLHIYFDFWLSLCIVMIDDASSVLIYPLLKVRIYLFSFN